MSARLCSRCIARLAGGAVQGLLFLLGVAPVFDISRRSSLGQEKVFDERVVQL